MRKAVAGCLLVVCSLLFLTDRAEAQRPNRAACAYVSAEFRRQGATAPVAARFAQIAWRESGCMPQFVRDWDDLSYSRLGLNFRGNMPRYWKAICGVSDYRATRILATDVHCALAAYYRMGWRPWN